MIIDTLSLIGDVSHNLIRTSSIAVPRGDISLWCSTISVASPWFDEGCQVSNIRVEGYAMSLIWESIFCRTKIMGVM